MYWCSFYCFSFCFQHHMHTRVTSESVFKNGSLHRIRCYVLFESLLPYYNLFWCFLRFRWGARIWKTMLSLQNVCLFHCKISCSCRFTAWESFLHLIIVPICHLTPDFLANKCWPLPCAFHLFWGCVWLKGVVYG